MNKIKCVFWFISLTLTSSMLSAQVKDSIPAKSNLFSKIKLAKVNLFKKSSKDEKGSKTVVDIKNDKKPVAREEKTFEIIRQKDTATKKSPLSKISLPKKNTVSEDSAMKWEKEIDSLIVKYTPEKDSSSLIAKETTTNASILSNTSLPSNNKVKRDSAVLKVKDTASLMVKDTTKKSRWFSRLNLTKKNTVKKDTTKAKDTTSLIVKDATPKESDLSKLSSTNKNKLSRNSVRVKAKDSSSLIAKDTTKKSTWLSRLNLTKKNTVKKDSTKGKDTTSLEAKDATTKESDLSTLTLPNKNKVYRDSVRVKAKDSSLLIVKDTIKKSTWLSRLNLTKKNTVKKDSTKAKDTTSLIAKDATIKESDLSTVSSPNKNKVNRDSVILKAKDSSSFIAKDTTKKSTWLSRLNLTKKNTVKKDSTKVKDTVALIAKDANTKESNLSKLSLPSKNTINKDNAILKSKDSTALIAKDATNKQSDLSKLNSPSVKNKVQRDSAKMKAKDSSSLIAKDTTKKSSWLSRLNLTKKNTVKKDSKNEKVKDSVKVIAKDTSSKESSLAKLSLPSKNLVKEDTAIVLTSPVSKAKDTLSSHQSGHQKFLQYMSTTTVSLMAGASFSKQTVDAGGFKSNFNYVYSDIAEDVYKMGYLGGVRVDGLIKKKHEYSVSFSVSQIASGANYSSSSSLTPLVGSFSTFKAEDRFWVMNVAGHYKKLLPLGNLQKYKFYVVGGPSMDARLSKASLDNQATNAYRKIFLKADLGLEFSNRSLYTLFFNYQQSIGSITKKPIKTNLNSFQLGIIIKAKKIL